MKPFRINVEFDNGQTLSLRAHRDEPTKLVAKSRHPEALDALLMATGVDPLITDRMKGAQYFIAVVDMAAVGLLLTGVLPLLAKTRAEPAAGAEDDATEDAEYDPSDTSH